MQPIRTSRRQAQGGHALVLTVIFTALSLLLLSSIISRSSSNSAVTERNNAFNRAVGAAEAATETVLARKFNDFINQSIDYSKLDPYRNLVTNTYMPVGWPTEYEFSDTSGAVNKATVTSTGPS